MRGRSDQQGKLVQGNQAQKPILEHGTDIDSPVENEDYHGDIVDDQSEKEINRSNVETVFEDSTGRGQKHVTSTSVDGDSSSLRNSSLAPRTVTTVDVSATDNVQISRGRAQARFKQFKNFNKQLRALRDTAKDFRKVAKPKNEGSHNFVTRKYEW